jgi:DNA polymerase III alpha subunit
MSFYQNLPKPLLPDIRNDGPLQNCWKKFSDYPKLLENTESIIARCNFNSNLKHLKTKPIIQKVENDINSNKPWTKVNKEIR